MSQSVFDVEAAKRARDEAIDRVESHSTLFVEEAVAAIRSVARVFPKFTTDDVWSVMTAEQIASMHEPRAMGAAMRRAVRLGIVSPTTEYRRSQRAVNHHRPMQVWASNLFSSR